MPCYNAAAYITDAIESVLDQTFRDFELLIVDDGSTDRSADIVRSFNDERIILIQQSKQGIAAALNFGLLHARAEYIARFDADDICMPERLERQYRFMLAHPDYIVVGSAANYIDDSGEYIFTHQPRAYTDAAIRQLPFRVCPFIHAGVMYKKNEVLAIGYNFYAHSFEDHLLWMRLKEHGKMYNIPEQLIKVRLNAASLTIDERKRPAGFHRIKNHALKTGSISAGEGEKLAEIIRQQSSLKYKRSAYNSLLGKKFLWNNYDPQKARFHIKKAIGSGVFDIKDYLLMFISYLPENMINRLYLIFADK